MLFARPGYRPGIRPLPPFQVLIRTAVVSVQSIRKGVLSKKSRPQYLKAIQHINCNVRHRPFPEKFAVHQSHK